jgi:hypothetical protein
MTGFYAYKKGKEIEAQGYPFDAIIQAAMRQADSDNLAQLAHAFPLEYQDLKERYNLPGGLRPGESA